MKRLVMTTAGKVAILSVLLMAIGIVGGVIKAWKGMPYPPHGFHTWSSWMLLTGEIGVIGVAATAVWLAIDAIRMKK